jgi:hypothetical protein
MNKKFIHCITYAPSRVFHEAVVVLGLIFGLYYGIAIFFPCFLEKIVGWTYFLVTILASLIYGRLYTWKKSKIAFRIPNTNTTIEIVFDDLFKQEGLRVIPVNEFFDSEIGKPVSDKSLHGIFIENHLKGRTFDGEIDSQLNKIISAKEVPEKIDGKTKKYPIGTTVKVTTDAEYLLFALAKTDPKTCKAYCNTTMMLQALEGLWQKTREESNGNPVNVPLVGSGQSGVGLPSRNLLDIIILSVIRTTQEQRVVPKIRIILYKDHFEELDLRSIKQYWRY